MKKIKWSKNQDPKEWEDEERRMAIMAEDFLDWWFKESNFEYAKELRKLLPNLKEWRFHVTWDKNPRG